MAPLANMAPQRDFILFDDPAPSTASRDNALSPPSSHSKELLGIGSFSKHRSPRQSPALDDVSTPLPDTLDQVGGPRRKRHRSQAYPPSAPLPRPSCQGTSDSSAQASNQRLSPPHPPSGSLGPPMHHLTLADSTPACKYHPNPPPPALTSLASAGMTLEQQERVKAQIRAELAGVDTRAFKGPLRDILQKQDYTPRPTDMQTSPLSASSDPMQAGVAPSFALFPDYHLGDQSQRRSSQIPNKEPEQERIPDQEMPPLHHRSSADLRTRSSTFDNNFAANSYPPARHSHNYLPDWARQSQSIQGSQIAYSHHHHHHYHHQQQQSQQQSPQSQHSQQQRPSMPPPAMSQSQLAQRGGPVSMASTETYGAPVSNYPPDRRRPLKRESSGLTVSPQEAFLDYNDVENALSHSGLGKMPSLFASVPPGLSDAKDGSASYSAGHTGTNTPRIGSQQNVTPARSSTGDAAAAYAARPVPMSRNDTARPHHYQQKRPGPSVHQSPPNGRSPYPNHSDGRGSVSQESGSQSSLFSPADSGDTISTDEDEDERPYYPPNMKPSMIRGGPSSLYLNYPVKADGSGASGSPAIPPRPLLGKERTSSTGSSTWSHVRNEPWAFRQTHTNQPRFSDVSASSSDSEDDRSGRRSAYSQSAEYQARHGHPYASHPHPHHSQHHRHKDHHHQHPHQQQPYGQPIGGYPHSRYSSQLDPRSAQTQRPSLGQHQSSSESVDDTSDRSSRPYVPLSRQHMPGAMGGYGYIPGSQESGLSVAPPGGGVGGMGGSQDEGSISPSIRSSAQTSERKLQQEVGAPPPLLAATRQPAPIRPAAPITPATPDLPIKQDRVEARGEEEPSETGNSGSANSNESDYEDNSPDSTTKETAPPKTKSTKPSVQKAAAAPAAADGTTKCNYVSPITGVACQTAFHRPYDLARHRETIHAREEAGFMREGKLKLEDCIVLGKEVDPKKSTAVVEWKCKSCGANFSRKDAMLRHERLRHNGAK